MLSIPNHNNKLHISSFDVRIQRGKINIVIGDKFVYFLILIGPFGRPRSLGPEFVKQIEEKLVLGGVYLAVN